MQSSNWSRLANVHLCKGCECTIIKWEGVAAESAAVPAAEPSPAAAPLQGARAQMVAAQEAKAREHLAVFRALLRKEHEEQLTGAIKLTVSTAILIQKKHEELEGMI